MYMLRTNILKEDMTKSEVNSIVKNQMDSTLSSKDFEKRIKEIAADVLNDLFKILWQRNSTWKSNISR